MDENNIYRCEGRLRESQLLFEVKTPILINSNHRLAKLIITDLHLRLKHIFINPLLRNVVKWSDTL